MITSTKIGNIELNNSQDNEIIREILLENRYSIDERITLEGTVLDIGAHIGIFSRLALTRGCEVISVEPEAKNFRLLQINAPGALFINKAVSSIKDWTYLEVHPTRGEMHHLSDHGVKVPTTTLDELITKKINVLKMDIEGGEYDALMKCSKLDLVEQITMEYHLGIERAAELITLLNFRGFKPVYINGEDFGQLQFKRL